ncbi:efflux RND transporter periplasmic adaptor subunit [Reinekea blandensis]|uniref:Putative substate-binding protein involved in drug resistance n=1 Tax=Reinekea blandensis MED297 TaxID=314283 RepID=A4BC47_9GAMM|nr:efflux RND transporter periplasmic adaptor subunit [Reinekea blandensis]EAR10532.1 putative substate-binding protein involved in drug resistance [Reinekea sp. MED297] [Reinekea blandensis MED297]
MKKLLLVLVIIAAIVGLSLVGQQRGGPAVDEVRVFDVIEQPIESTVLATGTLRYGDERRIRAELDARVEEVRVDEGDPVREGQVLIVLQQDDYETEVNNQRTNVTLRDIDIERAQLQIESLNIQLARQQKLFDQNAAQASTLEDLRNQIAQAEVNLKMQRQLLEQSEFNLAQAQKRLNKTVIRSPMDGMVSALDIKVGELAVATGADIPLMTLVDPTQIYSEVDVDEADIGNVLEGQSVRIFAVAYLDTPLDGVVTDIATSARQVPGKNSLVFPVEVEVQPQDEVVLRPGMSTRAEILNSTDRAFPLVPIEAVQEDAGETGYRVFVFEEGVAQMRSVSLGPQDDRYQAITEGISVGDQVITGPYRVLRRLSDGATVAMESADESTD